MQRPTWHKTFMDIALILSERSTCLRRKVGAVLVDKNNRVLSVGYNGAPPGQTHCEKLGCLREELNIPSGERQEICRAVHAEANALLWARKPDEPGAATLYVTAQPCSFCARLIATSPIGIKRIIYKGNYPDKFAVQILKEAGIELINYSGFSG